MYTQQLKANILTDAQVRDLIISYMIDSDENKKLAIINSNLGLIHKYALKLTKNSSPFYEDLISAGIEGVIMAMYRFNHKYTNNFSSFCFFYIKMNILKTYNLIKNPTSGMYGSKIIAIANKYDITFENFNDNPNSFANLIKMCEENNINMDTAINIINGSSVLSISSVENETNADVLNNMYVSDDKGAVEDEMVLGGIDKELKRLLNKNEYKVFKLMFIDDSCSQAELAESMGCTRQNINLYYKRSLEKLKASPLLKELASIKGYL